MQQQVTINLYSQDGTSIVTTKVNADVVDNFAVHRAIRGDGYTVTHVPTSLDMGSHNDLSKVLARREYLRAATVGGIPVAELPACEICANALLIAAQLGRVRHRADAVLKKAAHVADVLCRSKE